MHPGWSLYYTTWRFHSHKTQPGYVFMTSCVYLLTAKDFKGIFVVMWRRRTFYISLMADIKPSSTFFPRISLSFHCDTADTRQDMTIIHPVEKLTALFVEKAVQSIRHDAFLNGIWLIRRKELGDHRRQTGAADRILLFSNAGLVFCVWQGQFGQINNEMTNVSVPAWLVALLFKPRQTHAWLPGERWK